MHLYNQGQENIEVAELTDEEWKFIWDELHVTCDRINAMTDEEYWEFILALAEIEGDENVKCDGRPLSKRGRMVTSIIDKVTG